MKKAKCFVALIFLAALIGFDSGKVLVIGGQYGSDYEGNVLIYE